MTQIFNSYEEFLQRQDKAINGVSPEFASTHPDYSEQNETNLGCWNCRYCSDCRYCRYCSYCSYCSYCIDCSYCSYCSYCIDCSDCSYCSDCSDCSYCSSCSDKEGDLVIPQIEGIHSAVLQAVNQNGIEMSSWHSECGTTHCRAGWVVTLAGEAGKELERKTDTAFAAMCIYNKSSSIKVALWQFYVNNNLAMDDIKRCAEEEKAAI